MVKDRVKETTTTTGTGNITLAGAVANFVTFTSVVGLNQPFTYCIEDVTNTAWEVGLGYLSGTTTLVRQTVYASSNAAALVNLAAGTKNVFITIASVQTQGRGFHRAMSVGFAQR